MGYDHRGQIHAGNVGLFDDYEDYESEREQEKREKRRQKKEIRLARKAAKNGRRKGFRSRLARLFGGRSKRPYPVVVVASSSSSSSTNVEPSFIDHRRGKSSFGCNLGYEAPPPIPSSYPYAKEATYPPQSLFLQELGMVKIHSNPAGEWKANGAQSYRNTQVWHEQRAWNQ
ncbi:hypothetical protein K504DRAFT_457652 [Pleomassaria siparia CBS 279.74]|uniref:Uncharacterized protein n=1 Tax=Pleomassaria siparia CBS 279.74 TaxID=1314801 RepID=A0A6G1KSX3_9PLEO|nr:hypothetical protein K504DRAFT_457652 [Pleomassaria siparia CBS 279.74]